MKTRTILLVMLLGVVAGCVAAKNSSPSIDKNRKVTQQNSEENIDDIFKANPSHIDINFHASQRAMKLIKLLESEQMRRRNGTSV